VILPYKFKLVNQQYDVQRFTQSRVQTGHTLTSVGVIQVATHHRKGPRRPKAIQLTFWHEATHAILHDMGDPLWRNEQFVTEFSKRLVQLINTAEFK